jgi:hypothetical protein
MQAAVIVLTISLSAVSLMGPPQRPVQNYDGLVHLPYPRPLIVGDFNVANFDLSWTSAPGETNLTFDRLNDTVQTILIGTRGPEPIRVSNASGSWTINGSFLTASASPGVGFLDVTGSPFWLNQTFGGSFDVGLATKAAGYPYVLGVGPARSSSYQEVYLQMRFRPPVGTGWVKASLANASILQANGTLIVFHGNAMFDRLPFSSVDVIFATKHHFFNFESGESLTWYGGGFSLGNVTGSVTPREGNIRPFQNAAVITLSPPQLSRATMTFDVSLSEFQITFHTEATTVRVTDAIGTMDVGAVQGRDLIEFEQAPTGFAKAALLLSLVALSTVFSIFATRPPREKSYVPRERGREGGPP